MINTTINFTNKKIRVLCIDNKNELVYLNEEDSPIDFSEDISVYDGNENLINELSEIILDIFKEGNVSPLSAKIILDVNQFFINSIPVETFEPDSVKSYIVWDLSNFFPDTYKNYIINYHKVLTQENPFSEFKLLTFAVKSNTVKFINDIINKCNFKTERLDIDLFSSYNVVKVKNSSGRYLILNCYKNRIDYIICNNNDILCYEYLYFKENNFDIELETNIKLLNINKYFSEVKNIYITGEEYSEYVVNEIKSYYPDLNVNLLNFDETLKLSNTFSNTDLINKYGYKFISLAGAVI